jgi:hypothetical protein
MLPSAMATRDLVGAAMAARRSLHKWRWSCSNSLGQTPFKIAIVVLPRHDVQPTQLPTQTPGRISLSWSGDG